MKEKSLREIIDINIELITWDKNYHAINCSDFKKTYKLEGFEKIIIEYVNDKDNIVLDLHTLSRDAKYRIIAAIEKEVNLKISYIKEAFFKLQNEIKNQEQL